MTEYNPKPRTMWCETCRVYFDRVLEHNALCRFCGNGLITVLFSLLDEKPMTGRNELVKSDNSPT